MRMRFSNKIFTLIPPKNLRQFSQLSTTTPSTQHFSENFLSSSNLPEKIISPKSQSSKPSSQNKILDTLLRYKSKPKSVLKFFQNVERKRGFVKTVDFFCLLLQILSSNPETHGSVHHLVYTYVSGNAIPCAKVIVEQLLECSGRYGFESDSRVFNYFLKSFVTVDKITDAVECFRTMLEHDVIPQIPIMNTLLTAMVSRNMISDARKLYDEMVERGICDCYTFHVVMGACLNDGKFEEVEKFFEEAKVRGLELDATAYSIVVQAVCSRLNLNLGCELLKEMRELGWVPSESIYTTVILACVKQGNVVEALRLKDEMVSSGFCINLVVAASLIKGCSKTGNMEKAYELYTQMKFLGIQPTTAIDGLCKTGQVSKIQDKLNDFITKGFVPTAITYNSIINGFVKAGEIDSALSAYQEMCDKGISPNVITYTSLINGFCKCNKIDRALEMHNDMKNKGMELDVIEYGALIDGFCKRQDMESASKFFTELLDVGLTPNAVVYNSMISGFLHLNNMEAALNLHQKMIVNKIPCDLQIYTTLIGGLLLSFALDLYSEMLSKGIMPDTVMYTALINGLCNHGQLENASKILKEMNGNNITPSVLIYNILIAGNFREGNLQEAFRLHDEMLDKGLAPDDTTYDILVNGKLKVSHTLAGA